MIEYVCIELGGTVTACYVRFETMRNGKRKSQKRKHPIPTVIGQKRRRRPIDENV